MTTAVQDLLDSWKVLSDAEQYELIVEILRRTVDSEVEPMSDNELVLSAETVFLDLDRCEEQNEQL